MDTNLQDLANKLNLARKPEDIFGRPARESDDFRLQLKKIYHQLARRSHPDLFADSQDQLLAQSVLARLNDWFSQAQQKIAAGAYESEELSSMGMIIQTRELTYRVEDTPSQAGIFTHYPCTFTDGLRTRHVTLRTVSRPFDNDLAENEIRALSKLARNPGISAYSAYFPELIDSFTIQNGPDYFMAEVIGSFAGWHTLEDVQAEYIRGLDPRDMSWIYRRLLTALGAAHHSGLLHAAVLPSNILILPEQHGLLLANWAGAVTGTGSGWERTLAANQKYSAWYSEDILTMDKVPTGVDMILAAKCMLYLLGGNPLEKIYPFGLPTSLVNFFRGCILPVNRAPQDAWLLLKEFDELIEKLWGKRTFHPFHMGTKQNA